MAGVLVLAAVAVLGGIGVWASGLVGGSLSSTAQTIAAARAHQAAQGGLDWARWRLALLPAAPCAAAVNVVLPGQASSMTVTTRCIPLGGPYNDDGVPVRRWQITVSACNQPQAGQCPRALPAAGYVEAQVQAQLER